MKRFPSPVAHGDWRVIDGETVDVSKRVQPAEPAAPVQTPAQEPSATAESETPAEEPDGASPRRSKRS